MGARLVVDDLPLEARRLARQFWHERRPRRRSSDVPRHEPDDVNASSRPAQSRSGVRSQRPRARNPRAVSSPRRSPPPGRTPARRHDDGRSSTWAFPPRFEPQARRVVVETRDPFMKRATAPRASTSFWLVASRSTIMFSYKLAHGAPSSRFEIMFEHELLSAPCPPSYAVEPHDRLGAHDRADGDVPPGNVNLPRAGVAR